MELITENKLCELLKVDRVLIWRCRKEGLPFYRVGSKLIRYNYDDVLKWFGSQHTRNGEADDKLVPQLINRGVVELTGVNMDRVHELMGNSRTENRK